MEGLKTKLTISDIIMTSGGIKRLERILDAAKNGWSSMKGKKYCPMWVHHIIDSPDVWEFIHAAAYRRIHSNNNEIRRSCTICRDFLFPKLDDFECPCLSDVVSKEDIIKVLERIIKQSKEYIKKEKE